ncbi:MAG: ABC transporter permease [Oscillospiraceae bacterium]|nr:ABC transporter permease [Oscillospiraceae bacterium]
MTKKLPSITNKLPALIAGAGFVLLWQLVCSLGLVPAYMLPSPLDVLRAFWFERVLLWENALITLKEAFIGLGLGVLLGLVFATVMDAVPVLRRAIYPILVLTQTVPTVAIAPLLVLWFGYGLVPKVVLIVITTFFPVTVGLLDGFVSADPDTIDLLRSMGAGKWQIFRYIKFPGALSQFFSGLRIAAAYCVVGAVISEWLGGFGGLGVYMTRVKKAFAFDKMFAVIFLISAVSLGLMALVDLARRLCMPWQQVRENKEQ